MNKNKDLLLNYLCMALPYGVIVATPKGNGHLCSINQTIFGNEYGINIKATQRDYFNDRECDIKPYLRPMSSMTVEEFEEYGNITEHISIGSLDFNIANPNAFDWLNAHHFDYRRLVKKGLAVEVTKENNPYEY